MFQTTCRWQAHLSIEGVPVVRVERGVQLEAERHVGVRQEGPPVAHQIGLATVEALVARHLQSSRSAEEMILPGPSRFILAEPAPQTNRYPAFI